MTFFKTQAHLPEHRPDPRDPNPDALAPQIFLQFASVRSGCSSTRDRRYAAASAVIRLFRPRLPPGVLSFFPVRLISFQKFSTQIV